MYGPDGQVVMHAVAICVKKADLYDAVKQLRVLGGSGVLVTPMTYIFNEEPVRWYSLLDRLKIEDPMLSKV